MIECFFPELDHDFARFWRQIVSSDYGIPIFILAAMREDFRRLGGLQHTIGAHTEFRVFFANPDHPFQTIQK